MSICNQPREEFRGQTEIFQAPFQRRRSARQSSRKLFEELTDAFFDGRTRILAVADCYDALTSERPYRGAVPEDEALKVFEEASGTQFDPVIASAFLSSKTECSNGHPEPAPAFGTLPVHDAKPVVAPAGDA